MLKFVRRSPLLLLLTVLLFLSFQATAIAAETVHLTLTANGTEIPGGSTQTSLGRENTIECFTYEQAVTIPTRAAGVATGRRQYSPIKITKRIDRASPLLAKALTNNEIIQGTFRFYRPNPTGDGTTEQYYTVSIANGRIVGLKQRRPNLLDPAKAPLPELEEVQMIFSTITWTDESTGQEHSDSVRDNL